jgi:integrase
MHNEITGGGREAMARRANGEGSIYQRKDGRWAASVSLGRLKRKHFLGKNRAEVSAKLNEALAERQKGIPIVSNNQNVAQYLQSWLKSVKSSVRPRTYESYDLNVRRLTPLLGKRRLNQMTPAIVEAAYADLAASGLSNRSIVQAHTVLHNAMKKALQWGLIGRNPTEAADVPRPLRTEMQTLGEDEAKRLFAATLDDELHALWVVLTTTGLRLGEGLGLKWSDIDFENERLVVRRALQRQRENGLVFVEPKTSKSRRTVYFPTGTSEALKEHRKRQLEARLKAGDSWQANDLVFCRADGRPLEPGNVTHQFQAALKTAGLKKVRIHDLRHTAASLHLARGENPKVVQEMLGHSTIAVTMDIYSHVTPALHAAAASKMQVLFAVP